MRNLRWPARGPRSATDGAAAVWDSDEAIASESARITRWLAAAAIVGLAAIAALAVYGTLEISAALDRQADDAAGVILAADQHERSAQLSEAALIAGVAAASDLTDLATQNVAALTVQLGATDAQLAAHPSVRRDPAIRDWADATRLLFANLEAAAQAFLAVPSNADAAPQLAALFDAEEPYRGAIAVLQSQLQATAAANVSQTNRQATLLLGLTLCLLALEGLFLFRPVIRRVRGRARDAAIERESRFRSLIQNSPDVVTVLDAGQRIAFVSPSAATIWGRDSDVLRGLDFLSLVAPVDRPRIAAYLAQAAAGLPQLRAVEWRLPRPGAQHADISTTVSLMESGAGAVQIVLNSRDVTDRKSLERRLSQQALHDHLTGLPNRLSFLQRLEQITTEQSPQDAAAILFIDVDRFKIINDTLGHLAGDNLLRLVGERLAQTAGPDQPVARLGGDEFAVFLPTVGRAQDALAAAAGVQAAFGHPLDIDGREIEVALSIGIAMAAGVGAGTVDLMREADIALHAAKSRGGGRAVLYDETLNAFTEDRLRLETDLHRAVERDELRAFYQPVVDPHRRKACGMEALIRWQHPQEGLLPPGRFIDIAETTGQIDTIGRWILRQACRDMGRWVAAGLTTDLYVSVNVGAGQLQDTTLPEQVRAALTEGELAPNQLELEVTETTLLADITTSRRNLEAIRAMGVRVAIDDFGTGYSSLNYLRQLPVDTLKVDKSFMDEVERDPQAQKLFHAIVGIAGALELAVTVEGVETASQLHRVIDAGCARVQGYYFSPPVSHDAMTDLLHGRRPWADEIAA